MAYWRSYRRLSSQVNAFAAADSSNDENILENDFLLEPHSGQCNNNEHQLITLCVVVFCFYM
jgi:hypothetical protein